MIPHQTLIGRVWPADTHRFVCIRRKWKIRLETSLMPNLGYSAIKVMSWMDISRYCRLIWEPSNCYMIMISLTCGTSNWVLDSCFLRSKCSENLFRKLFAEKNLRKSFGAAAVVLALPCYLTPAVEIVTSGVWPTSHTQPGFQNCSGNRRDPQKYGLAKSNKITQYEFVWKYGIPKFQWFVTMFPIQNCAFLPPQIQRQGQREILSQSWWLVDTENHRESESATKSAKVNYPLVINTPLVISKCAANRISLKSSDMAPSCGRTMFARNACNYLSIYLSIYIYMFLQKPYFPSHRTHRTHRTELEPRLDPRTQTAGEPRWT
jgi:hypothetical protein